MIKGSADKQTVFGTVRFMMKHGLTVEEAIVRVESLLYSKMPENIKDLIRQECQD